MEDKGRWEGLVNRILGFSLAESLPEKKEGPLGVRAPPAGLPAQFILSFFLLFFFFFFLQKQSL